MKKIALTFLVALALTSCIGVTDKKTEMTGNVMESITTYETGNTYIDKEFIIRELTYKGHEYIWVKEANGYKGYFGISHSGSCPCHNKTN